MCVRSSTIYPIPSTPDIYTEDINFYTQTHNAYTIGLFDTQLLWPQSFTLNNDRCVCLFVSSPLTVVLKVYVYVRACLYAFHAIYMFQCLPCFDLPARTNLRSCIYAAWRRDDARALTVSPRRHRSACTDGPCRARAPRDIFGRPQTHQRRKHRSTRAAREGVRARHLPEIRHIKHLSTHA